MLVTDRRVCSGGLAEAVRRALAGGATAVMLREKDLATEDLVRVGSPVAQACRAAGALFVVNHDLAAASALGADGVHLGFRSASVADARAMVGEDALIGRSTHDPDEIDRAVLDGADYLTFGPVFDTPKKGVRLEPRGVAALEDAVLRARPVPVVALGGITAASASGLRRTGAAGVACIREILASGDETAAARSLVAAWGSAA
jgi:thiamine-phosphate pyrophosphorylase